MTSVGGKTSEVFEKGVNLYATLNSSIIVTIKSRMIIIFLENLKNKKENITKLINAIPNGKIRFLAAILAESRFPVAEKSFTPNFAAKKRAKSKQTITIGEDKNIFLNFDFKINSSPIAERLDRENTKRKITLEGCIEEISGRFNV